MSPHREALDLLNARLARYTQRAIEHADAAERIDRAGIWFSSSEMIAQNVEDAREHAEAAAHLAELAGSDRADAAAERARIAAQAAADRLADHRAAGRQQAQA